MRKARSGRSAINDEEKKAFVKMITSMLFSLFLVALSFGFIIGFRYFLKNHTYRAKASTEAQHTGNKDILELDDTFEVKHIIIRNLREGEEFCVTSLPGQVEEDSLRLENGQILEVKQKGQYKGKNYYRLKDGTYLEARESKVQELREYLPLSGYIAITYISSGGVRLRSWVDFEADNIVRSVYVGDKVTIAAMVTTTEGVSAFRTSDGLYITTNTQYFTDYTNLQEVEEAAEASEAAERAASQPSTEYDTDFVEPEDDMTEEETTAAATQETTTAAFQETTAARQDTGTTSGNGGALP